MAPIQINESAKRAANLRVLQKTDPSTIDIIGSAPHAVLYEFNTSAVQWEKQNVEGSLFVTQHSESPKFKIIVMNRNSKENLEVPLAASFQMQVREPYLIFRLDKGDKQAADDKQQIKGIWFHNGNERQKIHDVLSKVVKTLSVPGGQEVQTKQSQNTSPAPRTVSKKEAAASLMAALKISGSSSTAPVPQQKQQQQVKTPTNVQQTQAPKEEEASIQNMVLDKKSLQLSLMSLLNDDRFLDLIHAQYLKVARARENNSTPKK